MRKNRKKQKKNKIFLILLMICILLITTMIIIKGIKKQNDIKIITSNYQELNTNVEEFNQIRLSLTGLLNDFAYDNYHLKHEEYVKALTEYNNIINKIDKNINLIDKKCNNKKIDDICNSYENTYEKIINLYITDLNNYNDKITSYNKYKDKTFELFEPLHKEN